MFYKKIIKDKLKKREFDFSNNEGTCLETRKMYKSIKAIDSEIKIKSDKSLIKFDYFQEIGLIEFFNNYDMRKYEKYISELDYLEKIYVLNYILTLIERLKLFCSISGFKFYNFRRITKRENSEIIEYIFLEKDYFVDSKTGKDFYIESTIIIYPNKIEKLIEDIKEEIKKYFNLYIKESKINNIQIEGDKITWLKDKQDFVLLFSELERLGYIAKVKDNNKLLSEHFAFFNKKNRKIENYKPDNIKDFRGKIKNPQSLINASEPIKDITSNLK